jgi:hypothetical protein
MKKKTEMKQWAAELIENVTIQVVFDSVDVQTQNTFESYGVPHEVKAGIRRFTTKEKALLWVEAVNKDYGQVARFIGKTA